jgi:hypothetical protein
MTRTVPQAVVALVVAVLMAASALVHGQSPTRSNAFRATAAFRTVDGQPDLQGFWTNDTVTPLERPAEFGDKEILTPDEAAAYAKKRLDQFLAQPRDAIHYDDAIWQAESYSKESNRRTSLVTEPRNGKLPPLTAVAQKREAAKAAARKGVDPSDSAQTRSLAERCIAWGNVGPPMVPPTYNANLQIMQTRDAVVILHEMMHDARIIPLDPSTGSGSPRAGSRGDGSAHPPATIQYLAGDSRGRWDGDTLVVDTTNFTDKTNFRGPPLTTRQDIAATETLHVVERFTRIDANTIRYQFTVEDPNTWTAPWSGEIAIRKWDGPIYEYACHEGNYGLANILRAARVEDAKKARPARPSSN